MWTRCQERGRESRYPKDPLEFPSSSYPIWVREPDRPYVITIPPTCIIYEIIIVNVKLDVHLANVVVSVILWSGYHCKETNKKKKEKKRKKEKNRNAKQGEKEAYSGTRVHAKRNQRFINDLSRLKQ